MMLLCVDGGLFCGPALWAAGTSLAGMVAAWVRHRQTKTCHGQDEPCPTKGKAS